MREITTNNSAEKMNGSGFITLPRILIFIATLVFVSIATFFIAILVA